MIICLGWSSPQVWKTIWGICSLCCNSGARVLQKHRLEDLTALDKVSGEEVNREGLSEEGTLELRPGGKGPAKGRRELQTEKGSSGA